MFYLWVVLNAIIRFSLYWFFWIVLYMLLVCCFEILLLFVVWFSCIVIVLAYLFYVLYCCLLIVLVMWLVAYISLRCLRFIVDVLLTFPLGVNSSYLFILCVLLLLLTWYELELLFGYYDCWFVCADELFWMCFNFIDLFCYLMGFVVCWISYVWFEFVCDFGFLWLCFDVVFAFWVFAWLVVCVFYLLSCWVT